MKAVLHLVAAAGIAAVAVTLASCVNSESPAGALPGSGKPDVQEPSAPVIPPQPPSVLSSQEFEQARSAASSDQEQQAVAAASGIQGSLFDGAVDPATLELLRKTLAESQNPKVKAAIAAGLVKAKDPDSMPQLLDAMEDESLEVRTFAGEAVERIVGFGRGFVPDGPLEARQKKIATYRQFWDDALATPGQPFIRVLKNPEFRKELKRKAQEKFNQNRRKQRLNKPQQ